MMQYELAYDPTLAQIPYNEIQLSWRLNYYNVTDIYIDGTLVGELKGVFGSTQADYFGPLKNGATVVGTGALALIGKNVILNSVINVNTGANNLGLKPEIF